MQHLISVKAELKHSVVDKAVNQWRRRLKTRVRNKGQQFEQLLNLITLFVLNFRLRPTAHIFR